jgi:hypothetical protein
MVEYPSDERGHQATGFLWQRKCFKNKIIERADGKCLTFLIPKDGPEIPSNDLDHELTSVSQIEQATGLVFDFVPASQKQTIPTRRW